MKTNKIGNQQLYIEDNTGQKIDLNEPSAVFTEMNLASSSRKNSITPLNKGQQEVETCKNEISETQKRIENEKTTSFGGKLIKMQ